MSDTSPALELDLGARLELALGSRLDKLERNSEMMRRALEREPAQPIYHKGRASGVGPASGPVVLTPDLAPPDQGNMWFVRGVMFSGNTVGVGTTGGSPALGANARADFFVGTFTPPAFLSQIGVDGWHATVTPAASGPGITTYSSGIIPVQSSEQPFAIVQGVTAGTQFLVEWWFEQVQLAAIKQAWALG